MNNSISLINTPEIVLPIYIQKLIIRILAQYIDNNNSSFRAYSYYNHLKTSLKEEIDNKRDVISFSLVNKCWFGSLSKYLTISNDFVSYRYAIIDQSHKLKAPSYNISNISDHYIVKRLQKQQKQQQETSFKLLKDENIRILVLNIDQWDIFISSTNLPILLFQLINEVIKKRYINLEKICISNTCKYKYIESIEFNYIKIRDSISNYTIMPNNIKEIHKLELLDGIEVPINEAYQLFKVFNSIDILVFSNFMVPEFNFKSLFEIINTTNCLKDTQEVLASILTIKDIYYLLKLATNVKELNITICFDNLLTQISDHKKECECNTNNNKNKKYWESIIKMLSENKKLKLLSIYHECKCIQDEFGFNDSYIPQPMKNQEFSNTLIEQLLSILKLNSSISKFELENINSKQILTELRNFKNQNTKITINKLN